MTAEALMRLRCNSPRCHGSITRPQTESEPEGIRAAAAVSGWTVVGGATSLAHRILTRDMSPQDRCPACNRGRPVVFSGSCPHCGGMGPIGTSGCMDCGQSSPETERAADSDQHDPDRAAQEP
ncbi:hypothetical protein [Streptacidiphilus anmyonensis]|uniref:hypothetical protein n=1 Tax=Streptacidiphilus anmyonensis TaxID=405782 RepID=UPI00128AE952|nr:hypothetical protein [Streptacidiphilus anmyonensis]